MAKTFLLPFLFLTFAHLTIGQWAISVFFDDKHDKLRLPISAWYPFSYENPWVYSIVYIYQVYGISMSAVVNSATDTFASSMIFHLDSQIKRLGIQLSKVKLFKSSLYYIIYKIIMNYFRLDMKKTMTKI
ncbi:CLUMA_CG012001, isoform A [Clunio marinus]|uniref:CLUMA_CG012001, isoform A n=1 Tax=Clunio marinus TaxID=568069 RepID=A0A1J1IFP8_9DIPT|nr:CLUMA_CG012001, isoform A [Clunio marinus]